MFGNNNGAGDGNGGNQQPLPPYQQPYQQQFGSLPVPYPTVNLQQFYGQPQQQALQQQVHTAAAGHKRQAGENEKVYFLAF
jgi:hypothetical protein